MEKKYENVTEILFDQMVWDMMHMRAIIYRLLNFEEGEEEYLNGQNRWRYVNDRLIVFFSRDFQLLVDCGYLDSAAGYAMDIANYIEVCDSDILTEQERHTMASFIRAKLLVNDYSIFMRPLKLKFVNASLDKSHPKRRHKDKPSTTSDKVTETNGVDSQDKGPE